MYTYPPLQAKLYPSIEDVNNAVLLASNSFEKRDVRPLQACSMRVANASVRLAGDINTRLTAILSYDWNIFSASGDDTSEIYSLNKKIINTIIKSYIKCPLFGVFAISYDWEYNKEVNRFLPANINVYKPYELDYNDFGDVFVCKQKDDALIKSKLSENSVYMVYNTDWIGGIMRSVLYLEVLKNITVQEWHVYNRKVKGLIQGKSDGTDKSQLVSALRNFVNNNIAITDKDVEIVLNELAGSNYNSYIEFINFIKNEVSVAILGQANISELPSNGGSRAALQVLQQIKQDIVYSDLRSIKDAVNQYLEQYISINYGVTKNNFFFDFVYDTNDDLETNARVIEILLRAGLPLDKTEVYKKVGFNIPTDDNNTILSSGIL